MAIVHDYLTQRGGAERVVLSLTRAFPEAPVYASFYDAQTTFPEFQNVDVRPLWINHVLPLRRRHRLALPLLPLAFRTSAVDADTVVCSSSGWAHGIRTRGRKIVYCHSPAKWLYRPEDYLGTRPAAFALGALRVLAPFLRRFDRSAARSADAYLANSTFIASQILDVYGIDAEVLSPPAGLEPDGPREPINGIEPGFFLTVARLLPYKNVAQVVEAFRHLPNRALIVVGDGPERERLAADAPENVRFLGRVEDASLRWLYANSSGLIAASREDFGLTPVEAASFGKPVAALRWGGFLDTVIPASGVFFEAPDPLLIARAVERISMAAWDERTIREHAHAFSEDRFVNRMRELARGP